VVRGAASPRRGSEPLAYRPPVAAQALGDVEVEDVEDAGIGERFRLFFGACGAEPGELLVVADGNGLFGTAVDLVRLMQLPRLVPPVLVVGVGYASAPTIVETQVQRARDFTPSPSRAFAGSGGAEAFRRFLRAEVLPRARAHAPTIERTTYFGHSLGGLFGTVDLVAADPVFDRHVISSPSLWWRRHALLAEPHPVTRGEAFFGIGADETDAGRRREGAALPEDHPLKPVGFELDMVDDLMRFTDGLRASAGPGVRLETVVIPGEYHATVAPISLSRGLRWLFEDRKTPG
jgi:predicted alpha/beta superfamily hydrolase